VGARGSLRALFEPRSVAVVGASEDPAKFGGRVVRYLAARPRDGSVPPVECFPVNPRHAEIMGFEARRSLAEIGRPIDLAVLAVPAAAVPAAIDDCVRARVGAAVVFASGFAEAGEAGRRTQQAMVERAAASGLRVLGPNCIGMVDVGARVAASFATLWVDGFDAPGPVAIASQSGATASYVYVMLQQRGVGVSLWTTTGNEADVDVADCIDYGAGHAGTRVIVAAIEGVRDGARLLAAIRRAREAGKAVLVLKVGRSALGGEVARSHTGALAGEDRVFDAAIARAGALRCRSYEDLVDMAAVCAAGRWPEGRCVGVVTASGGAGILLSDRAEDLGIELPGLSAALRAGLDARIPAGGASRNPVDVTAAVLNDFPLMIDPIVAVARSGEVDAVIAFLTSAFRSDASVAQVIEALCAAGLDRLGIPVLLSLFTSEANLGALQRAGFPAFVDPVRALQALDGMVRLRAHVADDAPPAAEIEVPEARDETTLLAWLALNGIPAAPTMRVHDEAAAIAAARALGLPVAVKVSLPGLAHKADVGGVRIGLATEEEVREAAGAMLRAARALQRGEGAEGGADGAGGERVAVVVQAMAPAGVETFMGFRRDPQFGPVVAFGLGGKWVEAMDDVALQPAPFGAEVAMRMIRGLRGRALLEGGRGGRPVDLESLAHVLSRFSQLAAGAVSVDSMEVNPFVVVPGGAGGLAVDAKLVPCAPDAAGEA
jgi:acyl-CoA synthetase (NDP forming)